MLRADVWVVKGEFLHRWTGWGGWWEGDREGRCGHQTRGRDMKPDIRPYWSHSSPCNSSDVAWSMSSYLPSLLVQWPLRSCLAACGFAIKGVDYNLFISVLQGVLPIGVGVIFDIAFDAGFTPILTFPRQGVGIENYRLGKGLKVGGRSRLGHLPTPVNPSRGKGLNASPQQV